MFLGQFFSATSTYRSSYRVYSLGKRGEHYPLLRANNTSVPLQAVETSKQSKCCPIPIDVCRIHSCVIKWNSTISSLS